MGNRGISTSDRGEFVRAETVRDELGPALRKSKEIEAVTFSGAGEPTLAANLPALVQVVRSLTDVRVGILTNSSLLCLPEVRKELADLDFIVAKLDAADEEIFQRMNRPHPSVRFADLLGGIESMSREFKGDFHLLLTLTKDNAKQAERLADFCRRIGPDLTHLNTPLRPCDADPLGRREMLEIQRSFKGLRTTMVYEAVPQSPSTAPLDRMSS